eukprot:TRINITY_DN2213_c2_g1_i1.p1 TRINITY_DN2213_c2_g1~~TRINITY_DN2213_c2_g1_i1.p1  ORF type:complete len:415 (+),score=82.82 TRINITY_DN2213_c2_g1_i1:52-1245(+)
MGNIISLQTYPVPVTKHFHTLLRGLPRMEGKTVAITGCTSGTGLVCAKACRSLGARVLMLNRKSSRADSALQLVNSQLFYLDGKDAVDEAEAAADVVGDGDGGGDGAAKEGKQKEEEGESKDAVAEIRPSPEAILIECDLMRFDSVKAVSEELYRVAPEGIDVLCNNAGVMGMPDVATDDGCDVQMQVNHLSHFLLTSLVWPLLERATASHGEARVVNHSSGARSHLVPKGIEPEYLEKNGGFLGGDGFPGLGKWRRYSQSKLANLMFTYALDDWCKEKKSGVKIICAHPGPTHTGLQAKTGVAGGNRYLDNFILNRAAGNSNSPEDGSMGIVIGCCQSDVESGQFFGPSAPGAPGPAELLPEERNVASQTIVWDESLRTLGLTGFGGDDAVPTEEV